MINQSVEFEIKSNEVPIVRINGEEVPIVSCSYHYVTSNGVGPGANQIIATVINPLTGHQILVAYDCITGMVFIQGDDWFKPDDLIAT
ncbi:hypothetical protein ABQD61_12795 [Enterococcus asini]|uniref:hypothetical protein n=1 Tax=Enterococcus asini TaxID=57732 RepID=UPI0032E4570D